MPHSCSGECPVLLLNAHAHAHKPLTTFTLYSHTSELCCTTVLLGMWSRFSYIYTYYIAHIAVPFTCGLLRLTPIINAFGLLAIYIDDDQVSGRNTITAISKFLGWMEGSDSVGR